MLFSVLWLSAALAIGFVPNNQRGIFVEEKQCVLVLFVLFFFSGPPNFRGLSNTFSEVV